MQANPRQTLTNRVDQFVRHGWQLLDRTHNPPEALLFSRRPEPPAMPGQVIDSHRSVREFTCRRVWIGNDGTAQWENVPCPPSNDSATS